MILCEDNTPPTGQTNTLQALTRWGQLIPIADHLERPGVEFAGAIFSPNGKTLYVNLQTGGRHVRRDLGAMAHPRRVGR